MSDESSGVPTFTGAEWYVIAGRGRTALVTLDRDTKNFAHLIGKEVAIDGERYLCKGVEHFMHSSPWPAGERIGLFVTCR